MRKPNLPKLFATTLSLFLCFGVFCQYSGSTFEQSRSSKEATFYYIYDNTDGFAKNSDGNVKGLMIDIMKEFEKFLNDKYSITVNSRPILKEDFSDFMKSVGESKGGTFGLSNISITPARKKSFAFSPPCMDNVLLLLSHNSLPTLSTLDDLSSNFDGQVAYTLPESSYYQRLLKLKSDYYPSMKIQMVTKEDDIIQKITNEEAFAILDFNYYLQILKNKYPIKRHPVGDLKNDQFGIVMPKGSDWEPVMKEFFESGFVKSSRYSEIISTNLGSTALRLLNSVKTN